MLGFGVLGLGCYSLRVSGFRFRILGLGVLG